MVRAGVVDHPAEWKHSGYHEIMGDRQRYRIINEKRLLQVLFMNDIERLRNWYSLTLDEKIRQGLLAREEYWSRSVAVGESEWLKGISGKIGMKRYRIRNADSANLESNCYIAGDKNH